jgi:hypothetical protein
MFKKKIKTPVDLCVDAGVDIAHEIKDDGPDAILNSIKTAFVVIGVGAMYIGTIIATVAVDKFLQLKSEERAENNIQIPSCTAIDTSLTEVIQPMLTNTSNCDGSKTSNDNSRVSKAKLSFN